MIDCGDLVKKILILLNNAATVYTFVVKHIVQQYN